MKHIKKFENINNNTFDISEISDIINEFAKLIMINYLPINFL
jgi:hypothetical protein